MDVSIITVTFNSAGCLRQCLQSVLAQQGIAAELIVVDNASTDRTLQLAREFKNRLRLLENRENVGFGRACNQGFTASRGRFIYLLNPDAQLIAPDGLAKLCQALVEHPRWGMAGNCILSPTGEPQDLPATSYPDQARVSSDFSRLPGKLAWVLGASMILRREVYAQVGGFDPGFFLYGEETDLCLRIRQHGYEIGFVEEVAVKHIGAESERGCDPYETWTRRMNGLHRFWQKHYHSEDVVRLIRRDRLRAGYRMLINWALAQGRAPRGKAWQAYRRYRAVWEVSSKFLGHCRHSSGGA